MHLKEEEMRPKRSCLFIMHSTTFRGNQTPHNSSQHGGGGIRVWASCSHWENLEKTGSSAGQSPDLNLRGCAYTNAAKLNKLKQQRRVDQNPPQWWQRCLRHKHQTCMEACIYIYIYIPARSTVYYRLFSLIAITGSTVNRWSINYDQNRYESDSSVSVSSASQRCNIARAMENHDNWTCLLRY